MVHNFTLRCFCLVVARLAHENETMPLRYNGTCSGSSKQLWNGVVQRHVPGRSGELLLLIGYSRSAKRNVSEFRVREGGCSLFAEIAGAMKGRQSENKITIQLSCSREFKDMLLIIGYNRSAKDNVSELHLRAGLFCSSQQLRVS